VVEAQLRPPEFDNLEIVHPGRDASRVIIAMALASLRDARLLLRRVPVGIARAMTTG
jgi:hypothetical protein